VRIRAGAERSSRSPGCNLSLSNQLRVAMREV
jgi:hypothetical protein